MVDKNDNPSNAELLKIATDIVMSEYVTKKNDVHEKWIVESLYLWQSQGVRMAYPQLPPYPSSKDIVERAKALKEILNLGEDTMPVNNNITITNTQTNNEADNKVEEKAKESIFSRLLKLIPFFTKSQ